MSSSTQQLKAKQRREKFAELLREMFQLNQPELDFGLYRIMHARKDDINRFIEKDLPNITQKAFSQFASQDKTQLEAELEKARKAAEDAGFRADDSPKVKELQAQLKDGFDLAREEGEVYDALVTFFNRYYSEGDFLSRRVYKDGTYAIPYQGEEVVLHWANKDQYYIKSSETLRDYTFRLNPDADPGEDPIRVHFKLVDAEVGAKDNNKEAADNKRVFVLDAEQPFELIEGEPNNQGETHTELQCRFHFRSATEADWTAKAKVKATEAASKKPPAQDALRAIAEERLLGDEACLPEPWKTILGKAYRKADGELADYSMLAGQLNNYTKKNTFDYFIHKDLNGFLTRELDFYIKNELLDWADIASLKNDPARLGPLLSKIEVIRSLGEKIITFLAQLENFQKKLWLKKKFVTDANYCITLDKLEEQSRLLEEAFENEKQLKDWEWLYKIDLEQLEKDRKSRGWKELLAKPEYRYMMVDTGNFDGTYKERVLAKIDNLDKLCDGLLVHSENFQALSFLQARYRGQVKCVYIDPPYNTGNDGFVYRDAYKSSTWMSMMNDRLSLARDMMATNGVFFSSINEIQRDELSALCGDVFGKQNRVEEIIWVQDTVSNNSPAYSTNHEYVEVFAKDRAAAESTEGMFKEIRAGYLEVSELVAELGRQFASIDVIEREIKNLYKDHKAQHISEEVSRGIDKSEAIKTDPWKGLYPYAFVEYRDQAGRYVEFSEAKDRQAKPWVWRKVEPSMPSGKQSASTKDPKSENYRYYKPTVEGITYRPPKRGWSFPYRTIGSRPSFEKYVSDKRIWFGGESVTPQQKYFLHEVESSVPTSVVRQYADGEPRLASMLGEKGVVPNPKPPKLIERFVNQTTVAGDLVADFFAGSGTTGNAVINMRRNGLGDCKYCLVEMGEYFDKALKSRLTKSVYADQWSEGKPVATGESDYAGVSQMFRYLRLESYEDSINNLSLTRIGTQEQLLQEADGSRLDSARQAYILNYLLEVETRGSQSLLNTHQFVDPTQYKLNVCSASGDETRPVNVDLLETFNYLLGLTVEHIAAPIHFAAELSQGEYGRWQAKVKRSESGKWWFRTVYGTNRAGQQVLVVWRNLPSVIDGTEDGIKLDNAVLDAVLIEKLAIRLTESQDDEVDVLYVNGDHNIAIPRNRKGEPMEQARIQLIEEAFHRLMFADTEQGV